MYNCSCLASDMSKIFDVYWYLGAPNSTIPSTWPASLDTSINNKTTLQIKFNDSEAATYLSVHTTNTPMLFMLTILLLFVIAGYVDPSQSLQSSPAPLCPLGRTSDIDAIVSVIDGAEKFVYVAVMDYFPTTQFPKHGEARR